MLKDLSLESEKKRILRAKKDLKEFDFLYRKYFPKINNFVFHRVENEAIRNDIVSNVFFKAMKKLTLFRFIDSRKCSFSSWLFRIAVNEINQYYRNLTRENRIAEMSQVNPQTNSELDYELVKEKMKNLSFDEQNLIALRYFEKMKNAEIAEIFQKKEGAIKVQIHRAMNKLRSILEKEVESEKL